MNLLFTILRYTFTSIQFNRWRCKFQLSSCSLLKDLNERKNERLFERIMSEWKALYYMCRRRRAGKDDIFGEDIKKSYFDESRKSGKSRYTVRAISYSDMHRISIDDLQAIMESYPEFIGQFLQNFGVTFNLREVNFNM